MGTHGDAVSLEAALANDTRGWIMSCVSGIGMYYPSCTPGPWHSDADLPVACIIGAGIVCIDVLATKFLGAKAFKLVESQAFLSSSLSLSAGVLVWCLEIEAL